MERVAAVGAGRDAAALVTANPSNPNPDKGEESGEEA